MTIEAATDTDIFRAYVQHVLLPTLRPGDVVILDNLSPHKNVSVTPGTTIQAFRRCRSVEL